MPLVGGRIGGPYELTPPVVPVRTFCCRSRTRYRLACNFPAFSADGSGNRRSGGVVLAELAPIDPHPVQTGTALSLISPYVGSTVRLVETATNSAGSVSAVSEPTSVIAGLLPSNTSLPSISGLLQDGQSLLASVGSWSGTTPLSYSYEWQLCNSAGEACKDISGAIESTLALISGDVNDTARVIVTATNSAGSTSATSAPTSLIGALLPSNTSLPSVGGLLQDGQNLLASVGSWSGSTPISYSYQWQQCNASGEACKNINEATGGTLRLISSLVGSTVRVIVTATNSGGSTQAASPATGLIAALLPGNTSLPVDRRAAAGRSATDRLDRHLVGKHAAVLHLPVGALQQLRRSLQRNRRGGRRGARARLRRCGLDAARDRDGDELRRLDLRDLAGDESDRGAAAQQHDAAVDRRPAARTARR